MARKTRLEETDTLQEYVDTVRNKELGYHFGCYMCEVRGMNEDECILHVEDVTTTVFCSEACFTKWQEEKEQ